MLPPFGMAAFFDALFFDVLFLLLLLFLPWCCWCCWWWLLACEALWCIGAASALATPRVPAATAAMQEMPARRAAR
ncbi:hypothetical protein AMK32_31470 [Streptomyces sp. CB01883]|nr:hypothetical protein AMK32_31470 [Streptomyces sp. CB01883]